MSAEGVVSEGRDTGPWDVIELHGPPLYSAVPVNETTEAVVWEVTDGRRAFGYLSRPPGSGPHPAVLCLSGFERGADPSWSEHYARRGYVVLVTCSCSGGVTPCAGEVGRQGCLCGGGAVKGIGEYRRHRGNDVVHNRVDMEQRDACGF